MSVDSPALMTPRHYLEGSGAELSGKGFRVHNRAPGLSLESRSFPGEAAGRGTFSRSAERSLLFAAAVDGIPQRNAKRDIG